MPLMLLLLLALPSTGAEKVQVVDGLITVRHYIDLLRIKAHVKSWIEDPGMNVLGRGIVMQLLAHHASDVNTLTSTLVGYLPSDVSILTPTSPSPPFSTNFVSRVKRNILGNLFSAISGMPTGEQFEHQTHIQEELRDKMSALLKIETEAERQNARAFSEVAKEEEKLEGRLNDHEVRISALGRATGRFFAYLELLEKDQEVLSDTLEAMKTGTAPSRLDAYLSRLSGLKSLGLFRFSSMSRAQVGSGLILTYLSRVYRDVEVLNQAAMNGSVLKLQTDDRSYLLNSHSGSAPPFLDELEVSFVKSIWG